MNPKKDIISTKIPFSTYDVLGYVIPGLTFLVSVISFEFWAIRKTGEGFHTPLYTLMKLTYDSDILDNWVIALFYLIIIISMTYVVGHIISSTIGYPTVLLCLLAA